MIPLYITKSSFNHSPILPSVTQRLLGHRRNPPDSQVQHDTHNSNDPHRRIICFSVIPEDDGADNATKVPRSTNEPRQCPCQLLASTYVPSSSKKQGNIPFACGKTCGTTAKFAPFEASIKNANPATSPIIVGISFGSDTPIAISKAPITTPRKVIHSFLAQTEEVCR